MRIHMVLCFAGRNDCNIRLYVPNFLFKIEIAIIRKIDCWQLKLFNCRFLMPFESTVYS